MSLEDWEKKVLSTPGAPERVAEIEDELRFFVEGVADRLASLPGVVAVSLGGSRAAGTHRPDSDWDRFAPRSLLSLRLRLDRLTGCGFRP